MGRGGGKKKKGRRGEEEHQIKGPEKEGLRGGGMMRGAVRKVQRGLCFCPMCARLEAWESQVGGACICPYRRNRWWG